MYIYIYKKKVLSKIGHRILLVSKSGRIKERERGRGKLFIYPRTRTQPTTLKHQVSMHSQTFIKRGPNTAITSVIPRSRVSTYARVSLQE